MCRDFQYKDKTVLRLSYPYDGNSFIGDMVSVGIHMKG